MHVANVVKMFIFQLLHNFRLLGEEYTTKYDNSYNKTLVSEADIWGRKK